MGIEETNYSAIDILNVVDGADLVTIVDEIYLCVWHGGNVVDIYDLTDPSCRGDYQVLPMFAPPSRASARQAIDEYFTELRDHNPRKDLTKPLLGVIVETESDDPTEAN